MRQSITKRVIGLLCILVALWFTRNLNIYSNSSKHIKVLYTKEVSEAYPLTVVVKGNGVLIQGDTIIRNREMNYILKLNKSITFDFMPDQDSELKRVFLDGKDIQSQIYGNKLTVIGEEKGKVIHVYFQNKEKENGIGPNTGHSKRVKRNALLFATSLGFGLWLITSKRRKRQHGC